VEPLPILHDGSEQEQVAPLFCLALQMSSELIAGLGLDRLAAIRTKLSSDPGEKQAEKVIDFGYGRNRALAAAARIPLFDADRGRDSGDEIDVRPGKLLDELPGIGVHRI
jgi:hypothetical protein